MEHLINDGDRPSRLRIDRHLTGEVRDPEVEGWLESEAGRAVQAELEAARRAIGPLDLADLRRRAGPAPANNTRHYALAGLLLAAIALFAVVPRLQQAPVDPHYVGVRGVEMGLFHLQGGMLRPYDGQPLGAGSVVGFKVDPGHHQGVVLLSVDGAGQTSVFYPEQGEAPLPLAGPSPLPGSLTLDDAPGPEIFVALFDVDVPTAEEVVDTAWKARGTDGLLELARQRGDVEAVAVSKR